MSGLVAADLKRQLGIPFVITFHALGRVRRSYQQQDDGFPDARFAIEDRIVAEADRMIAEAPQDSEDLIRLYGADPSRITIVPCGFDPEELWPVSKTLARISLGLPSDEEMILHVGRMVPRKGIDTVIRGFARLVTRHGRRARLLIVGGESDDPDPARTPEIGRLQRLSAEMQIEDRVTFVGRRGRDQLKYYYSAADVFVTTPWYEPFGITPLESMACGTPVVGANVGGIKYTVRDGETGYLVPPNDPDRLADSLHHLLDSPTLLGLFGRQSIQRVNDCFTWRQVARDLSRVYAEVTSVRPSADVQSHASVAPAVDLAFDTAINNLHEAKHRLRGRLVEAVSLLEGCVSMGGTVLAWSPGDAVTEAEWITAKLLHIGSGHSGFTALALKEFTQADDGILRPSSLNLCRQLRTLGRMNDVLLGITAQAPPSSMIDGFELAREIGLRTIALCGPHDSSSEGFADVLLSVPVHDSHATRPAHQALLHILGDLVTQRAAMGARSRHDIHPLSVNEKPRRARPYPSAVPRSIHNHVIRSIGS
jgi:glycosyltransferase involved in cell wall biosynthesis/phosphoheptose isomerase